MRGRCCLFEKFPFGKRDEGMEMIWNRDKRIGKKFRAVVSDRGNNEGLGF